MVKIQRKNITFTLSKDHIPAAKINSGEIAVFETYDCYHNQLLPETSSFQSIDHKLANPATGPLFIEGAKPGDTLKIEILDIQLGKVGVCDVGPNSGCLKGILKDVEIRRIKVRDNVVYFNDKVKITAKPMIGVIGVAPKEEGISTMTPKNHGGNMDCTQIKKNSILYLPVAVEGALLSMGDIHAVMGEGEVSNCGLEIEGEVTVRVSVLKGIFKEYPYLETEDKFIVIASEETVEEAWKAAVHQMYDYLTTVHQIEEHEAGMLLTLVCDLIICQTVNPYKTVRMEIPKNILNQYEI